MTLRDLSAALGFLLFPWRWLYLKKGPAPNRIEHWFQNTFVTPHAFTVDSGRSGLYLSLKALGIGPGDDVLVQGYTCLVVVNAIRWTGATPIFVDITPSCNIDVTKIEPRITPQTKALIVQHTFGQPAEMDEIVSIAKKHHLTLIEDCAHSLGAKVGKTPVGTFGDIAIFSFGSEKIISSVRGGAVIIHDATIGEQFRSLHSALPHLPGKQIVLHLLYYPFFFFGKYTYHIGLGKGILFLARKLRLIASIISPREKQGERDLWAPARFPNALAYILFLQLSRLGETNHHRQEIAALYTAKLSPTYDRQNTTDDSVFLTYPLFVPNPQQLAETMKQRGIFLDTSWSGSAIVPSGISLQITTYTAGACPVADRISRSYIGLPTHHGITTSDAERIIIELNTLV